MSRNMKRLMKDLSDFLERPVEGIRLISHDDDLSSFKIELSGSKDSPYEGGFFQIEMKIPRDFPISPPKIVFKTKMWHPNISYPGGAVCIDILNSNWKSGISLLECAEATRTLMIVPNPLSPLNADAATMMFTNEELFEPTAVLWTKVHAGGSKDGPELEEKLSIITALGLDIKEALHLATEMNWDMEAATQNLG